MVVSADALTRTEEEEDAAAAVTRLGSSSEVASILRVLCDSWLEEELMTSSLTAAVRAAVAATAAGTCVL